MRAFLSALTSLLFILFSFSSLAQDSSNIIWETTSKRIAPGAYQITLKAKVKSGWHVYAKVDDAEGLPGIQLASLDSSVKLGALSIKANYQNIKDEVFEGKTKNVAIGDFTVEVPVTIAGKSSSLFKLNISYEGFIKYIFSFPRI
jgi:hypothetical protein